MALMPWRSWLLKGRSYLAAITRIAREVVGDLENAAGCERFQLSNALQKAIEHRFQDSRSKAIALKDIKIAY